MKPAGSEKREHYPTDPVQALSFIMEAHGTAVLRTAYFYTGDRHFAEDISQEVFMRAFRKWAGFKGESSVLTWLTRITLNVCRDKLALKSAGEQPTDPGNMERSSRGSVEDEVLERLDRSELLKELFSLPLMYREVLYLYYYLDLKTAEIAEATGVPEGTVRGRLHRARQLLGERMQREVSQHE